MRLGATAVVGICLSACAPAPYPVYVYPTPIPLVMNPEQARECAVIYEELGRQQRIAAYSGVMATPLVEGSMRLNTQNVIASLHTRAALAGCPV